MPYSYLVTKPKLNRREIKQLADDARIFHAWWAALKKGKRLRFKDGSLITKEIVARRHAEAVRVLLRYGYKFNMVDSLDETLPEDLKERIRAVRSTTSRALRSSGSLNRKIKNCKACDLYSPNKKKVLGRGPRKANLVVIGEAPGEEEEKQGKPFVGKAGKSLDRVLLEVRLPREKIYLTNAVKCRPPNNRAPTKNEVLTCLNWLVQELKVVSPSAVIVLGRVSRMAMVHIRNEKLYEFKEVVEAPHPSAARFSKGILEKIKTAFRKVRGHGLL